MNRARRRASTEPPSPSPSFSSNLLDKVFRSIDEPEDNRKHHHQFKSSIASEKHEIERSDTDKKSKKHGFILGRSKPEDAKSSCDGKAAARIDSGDFRPQNSVKLNSSRNGILTSHQFDSSLKPAVNLKPIRTSHQSRPEQLLNDCQPPPSPSSSSFQNAKIRAMKMLGDLKNAKQPISPGGKLTKFITSLFSRKNQRSQSDQKKVREDEEDAKLKQAPPVTTCSSATSYYKACLSSRAPDSAKRSVRFCPVNVIIDNDDLSHHQQRRQTPRLVPAAYAGNVHRQDRKLIVEEDCRGQVQSDIRELLKKYQRNGGVLDIYGKIKDGENDGEDEEEGSCSSSDLFELDHIGGSVSRRGVSDELPVYETTQFQKHHHPAIW